MKHLVLQTDFGLGDGAVSAMRGVAMQVNAQLPVSDLTHQIPRYDIWSASYRLIQTIDYWPSGTVFVSVVDPGVGSHRRSIAAKTKKGHLIITPDNGTLSHLLFQDEIEEIRQIDETTHRLPYSQESHTFHGRDIYAYNGARLASGDLLFSQIGEVIPIKDVETLPVAAAKLEQGILEGYIDILDITFGSLWTNIPLSLLKELNVQSGERLLVTIYQYDKIVYQSSMPFGRTFAHVDLGEPLVYVNSLTHLGIALNQDSFSERYHIGYGNEWTVKIKKELKG